MLHLRHLFITLALTTSLVGCKSFETVNEAAVASTSCVTKLRSLDPASLALESRVDDRLCTEMTSYTCEKRIFGPDVSNRDSLVTECGSAENQSLCVSVRLLEFNTRAARDAQNESEFLPGGEYNRTEIQCTNRASQYKNVSLIQADGESVFSALNSTIQKCHQRSYL